MASYKTGTWASLFLVVYATLLYCSWNWLNSIVDWYGENHNTSPGSGWPAVFASVLLGAVIGVLWMATSALFIAVPAIIVIWVLAVVTMVFPLVFSWRWNRIVMVGGRQVTREIAGFVFKDLLKVGFFVAILSALLAYFVFFNSYSSSS